MNTRNKFVTWFQKNYTELYKAMDKTSHNVDYNNLNKYHTEGSVWTHTLMVMTVLEVKYALDQDKETILMASALLHDIGKVIAIDRIETKDEVKHRFVGHEGLSTYMCTEILGTMINDKLITYNQAEMIIKIVGLHGTNIHQYTGDLKVLLTIFRTCDKLGAVNELDQDGLGMYEERRFAKNCNPTSNKKGIMLVGAPCSGKSTFIHNNIDSKWQVISRDQAMFEYEFLEMESYGDRKSYNDLFAAIHTDKKIEKHFNEYFENKIKSNTSSLNVVVDMTMMSLSSRRKMIDKLGIRDWTCIVFMPGIKTLIERNKNRDGKYISDSVMLQMMKNFVLPNEVEGFSKVEFRF